VSLYADKDWANVGRSLQWIENDEREQVGRMKTFPVEIFCVHKHDDDLVAPVGYTGFLPTSDAETERDLVTAARCRYHRLPVSDHCAPLADVEDAFLRLCEDEIQAGDWVHFHCHGGDGRTTTFLAMYDMHDALRRRLKPGDPVPSVDDFAERQRDIFSYDLRPSASVGWKYDLALIRWRALAAWLDRLVGAG
jgi:hypothetical protein